MRFAYLDDAGTGNIKHDPNVVVAGVIVHADRQWKAVEKHLLHLVDRFAPPEHREGFVFHATELFSGGKRFPRERFTKEWRWNILDELCAIPARFHLPVVMACIERATYRLPESLRGLPNHVPAALAISASVCTVQVERFMRERAAADEVATLIYENNKQSRNLIKGTHNFLRTAQASELGNHAARYLPLERIIDTAHFAEKKDTSLLQIADICAFSLARKLKDGNGADRFFNPLVSCLVAAPRRWVNLVDGGAF